MTMTAAPQRKPFEPISDGRARRLDSLTTIVRATRVVRNRSGTYTISQQAFDALYAESQRIDGTIGGIIGFVADYLARTGQMPALLAEAMSEGKP